MRDQKTKGPDSVLPTHATLPCSFEIGCDPQIIEVSIAANAEHILQGSIYSTPPSSATVVAILRYFRRNEKGRNQVSALMAPSELYPNCDVVSIEASAQTPNTVAEEGTPVQIRVLPPPGANELQVTLVSEKPGHQPTRLHLDSILPVENRSGDSSGAWAKHVLVADDLDDQLVSVIIPVYNDQARLRTCLEALSAQEAHTGGHEIIVVDNGSTDEVRKVTDDFPDVTYILETKVGSYAARNTGAAKAKGNVLAFTDSDCVPHRDWLRRGTSAILSAETPRIVVGRIVLSWENGKGPTTIAGWWESCFGFTYQRFGLLGRPFINHGVTATMFMLRDTHERMNGFDEELYSGGDFEFSTRCTAKGIRIRYDDSVVISHPAREDRKSVIQKRLRIFSNQYYREMHLARGSVFRFFCRQLVATFRKRFDQVDEFVQDHPQAPGVRLKAFVAFEIFVNFLELIRITLGSGRGARRS